MPRERIPHRFRIKRLRRRNTAGLRRDVRAHAAGAGDDDGDGDAERRELEPQRVAVGMQRGFRGVIRAAEDVWTEGAIKTKGWRVGMSGCLHDPGDAADLHDGASVAAGAHERREGSADAHHCEGVCLEDLRYPVVV